MSRGSLTPEPHRSTWHLRLRRRLPVWLTLAAAVALGAFVAALSLGLLPQDGRSPEQPRSRAGGTPSQVLPSPSDTPRSLRSTAAESRSILAPSPYAAIPTPLPGQPLVGVKPTAVPAPAATSQVAGAETAALGPAAGATEEASPDPVDAATPGATADAIEEVPPHPSDTDWSDRLWALVNAERLKAGVAPLSHDAALAAAARMQARWLAAVGGPSHLAPTGESIAARAEQMGYVGWTGLAENVAAEYRSPEEVVAAWLASAEHRNNMLNPAYTDGGVGHYFSSEGGHFCVLDLGSR